MDDLAPELLGVPERRHVRLVGEVAVAVDQELRGEHAPVGMDFPALLGGVENRLAYAAVEPDVFRDRELPGDAAQVVMDLLAALQALRRQVGLEAEGILDEVGVAARAVPAMRVPHAAQIALGFENGVGNAVGAQVVGGADAGHAGADNDHAEVRIHGHPFASCGSTVASQGRKVTSPTPMARTATAGRAARITSGSGLPNR